LPTLDSLTIDQIGFQFNHPYLRDLKAGSPTDLSRETVAELNEFVIGNIGRRRHLPRKSDECLPTTLPLFKKDVHFLALAHEQRSANLAFNPPVVFQELYVASQSVRHFAHPHRHLGRIAFWI
jgi:methyl coenzyme M reductase subunit C-like uncharacterized protein (methanogenesis marker protein 7)